MSSRILIVGDFHIPEERGRIPDEFLNEMESSDLVICTGDLTAEGVLRKLEERAGALRVVGGEDDFLELPEQDLIEVEDMTVGLIHGHQLEQMEEESKGEESEGEKKKIEKYVEFAKIMQVDILVTGHTHSPFRTEREGVVLLNPGSATGVSKNGESERTCIRLEIEERDIVESKIIKT